MIYRIQMYISVLLLMLVFSGQVLACGAGDTPDDDALSNLTTEQQIRYERAVEKYGRSGVLAASAFVFAKYGIKVTKNMINNATDSVANTISDATDTASNNFNNNVDKITNILETIQNEGSVFMPGSRGKLDNLEN